ncbi:hypothetical protein Ait01nite_069510 [Actinoplanes italicus]|uniref:Uncharacterized protein n=1 Tax=Actinoplanes italicus TaxID=113567 RepID=A0A2T0JYK4_9ACTN|nr:hypothetical protein [Actinoplanes italicus]PRX13346.1 hypothetical protein CLV67_12558 [Actinoplanes italicus]GIE33906.1 hypothetical protein Ait01nite_069510 [Actinoplanes italicus]
MNLRKSCALAAGSIFLASAGIAVTTTPAVATPAPAGQTVVSADPWPPKPSRAFRQGFRDGRKDGWREARDECLNPKRALTKMKGLWEDPESAYMRGYEEGWERGYAEGYKEFCY